MNTTQQETTMKIGDMTKHAITKADARRLLLSASQSGTGYDVTNHYITRLDHNCYGTTRRVIGIVNSASFGWKGAIDRLKFSDFTFEAMPGGGMQVYGHPTEGALFLTLRPEGGDA